MTILYINTGTSANSGNGDSLRTAFNKINANFEYLSTASGAGTGTGGTASLGDIVITNNVISTAGTNEFIIFDPNGAGGVSFRNTGIQFDNGTGGGAGSEFQILQTRGAGSKVGLGLDGTNNSLRIVGDKQLLGTLADFGLYDAPLSAWQSRLLISHDGTITATGDLHLQGNIVLNKSISVNQNITTNGSVTATGIISALSGISFRDGTTLQTGVAPLTIGLVTTGTSTIFSNTVTNINNIVFDTESGFSLLSLSTGTVMVGMNSTFKYWEVAGQDTLVANGLDHIEIIAGSGITLQTNTSSAVKSITFSASAVYGGNLGNLIVDSTALYPNNNSLNVGIGNADVNTSTTGVSYILIPAKNDIVSPLIIASPNEVRITTDPSSPNPISIAPNQDGTGPGYVAIGGTNSTATAGVFLFSAAANVDLWPNQSIPQMFYASDTVGSLDLNTTGNDNISVRPGGTGSVYISGPTNLQSGIILNTGDAGTGAAHGTISSGTYRLLATLLDPNITIQQIAGGDYYLPPGKEGQLVYFAPKTGTDINQPQYIWADHVRIISTATGSTGTVVSLPNSKFSPFSLTNPLSSGITFAMYLNGAWQPHQSFVSQI